MANTRSLGHASGTVAAGAWFLGHGGGNTEVHHRRVGMTLLSSNDT